MDGSHTVNPTITDTDIVVKNLSQLDLADQDPLQNSRYSPSDGPSKEMHGMEYQTVPRVPTDSLPGDKLEAEIFSEDDYLPLKEQLVAWKPKALSDNGSTRTGKFSIKTFISGLSGFSFFTSFSDKNSVTSKQWEHRLKQHDVKQIGLKQISELVKTPRVKLSHAIEDDNVPRVYDLLRNASKEDINKRGKHDEYSIMGLATKRGNGEIIKALRSKGGDMISALEDAIQANDAFWLSNILPFVDPGDINRLGIDMLRNASTEDINKRGKLDRYSIMELATRRGNHETIITLQSIGGDIVSALAAAIRANDLSRLSHMLPFVDSEDINRSGTDNTDSVWFLASKHGHTEIMHALLAAGGDLACSLKAAINADDVSWTRTLCSFALANEFNRSRSGMESTNNSAWILACERGNRKVMRAVLVAVDKSDDPKWIDDLLHSAASRNVIRPLLSDAIQDNDLDSVTHLIRNASMADVVDSDVPCELGPWSLAVAQGDVRIVALLLRKGGNAHAALRVASHAEGEEDLQKLIQRYAGQGDAADRLGFDKNIWNKAEQPWEEAAFDDLVKANWRIDSALYSIDLLQRDRTVRILLAFASVNDLNGRSSHFAHKVWYFACNLVGDQLFELFVATILTKVDGPMSENRPTGDEILSRLIERPRSRLSLTPLMHCILANRPARAQLLLQKGADPHVIDRHGRTAMVRFPFFALNMKSNLLTVGVALGNSHMGTTSKRKEVPGPHRVVS